MSTRESILVVDDTKSWHETIEFILQDGKCQVLWAGSREQARKILETNSVSIVIVNLNLTEYLPVPDGTGYLMLEELKQRWPEVPRIALSTVEDADKVVDLYDRYGVVHVANKASEDFTSRLVHAVNAIASRPESPYLMILDDKQELINQLASLPDWKNGQHKERIGILLEIGLPEAYVTSWTLVGSPGSNAARLVNDLELKGPMVSAPDYAALGLLVKYLYVRCIEIEAKKLLARIAIRYCLTRDQEWLDSLLK